VYFFGDGNDEAQIGFHHFGFGFVRFVGEMLELLVGIQETITRHADEFFEGFDFFLFALNEHRALRRGLLFFEFVNGPKAGLNFIVNVVGNERHFFEDFLLVEEFAEGALKLLIGFQEFVVLLFLFGNA